MFFKNKTLYVWACIEGNSGIQLLMMREEASKSFLFADRNAPPRLTSSVAFTHRWGIFMQNLIDLSEKYKQESEYWSERILFTEDGRLKKTIDQYALKEEKKYTLLFIAMIELIAKEGSHERKQID